MAIVSLACGILCIPIIPIVFGMIALYMVRTSSNDIAIKVIAWFGTIIGSLQLPLLISLFYVFYHWQEPEWFRSSSSFSLTPPPAILNLQSVERESHVEGLIAKHTEGLNSQQLRANVILRLESNPEYKSILLAPYLQDGQNVGLGATFNYQVTQSGTKSRPRFIMTTDARSAKGAMIIADLVQKEYEKLHRSTKSEKVEFVKQTLEDLLETSLTKERQIASAMATFKNKHGMPYIEDEKRDNGDRKSQFANELTKSSLEKIRITSLLRQILAIKTRIGPSSESVSSKGVNDDIAVIKEFFEIDAIEEYGNIPALRRTLYDLERARRDYEETGSGYLEKHPKMIENARSVQQVKNALKKEVTSSIEDLRDKHIQLSAQEKEFGDEMAKVQLESEKRSEIEDTLRNFSRELTVVQRSTDGTHSRLNEVKIELALPSEQDEALRMESFASEPGEPYSPDKQKIKEHGIIIFSGVSLILLTILSPFFVILFLRMPKVPSCADPVNASKHPSDTASS